MEKFTSQQVVNKELEKLQPGETLLLRVFRTKDSIVDGKTVKKCRLEAAEIISDPEFAPLNGLSLFNPEDSRIIGGRPQRGYLMAEPKAVEDILKIPGLAAKIEALPVVTGTNPAEWEINVDVIHLMKKNFTLQHGSETFVLKLQVQEAQLADGVEPTAGAQPKINPNTGEILLKNGKPIYRRSVIAPVLIGQKAQHRRIVHDSVAPAGTFGSTYVVQAKEAEIIPTSAGLKAKVQ